MAGVKGAGGKVPKRSDQRRRRNKPATPVTETVVEGEIDPKWRRPNSKWHPTAKRLFESLLESGQSAFYEPSDWADAYLMCESLSRDLRPQFVGLDKEGNPVLQLLPLKGASLAAYQKTMTALCMTEGDRRRAGIELTRDAGGGEEEEDADVSELAEYRRRAQQSS